LTHVLTSILTRHFQIGGYRRVHVGDRVAQATAESNQSAAQYRAASLPGLGPGGNWILQHRSGLSQGFF
jgi:hypothetical protein